jgi:hypothetical protein
MRLRLLALVLLLGASACTALLRFGAGPPHARAKQSQLAMDGAGRLDGIAMEVDLYNPNPVDLRAARFDFHIEAGPARTEGSMVAEGALPPNVWRPVRLVVPLTPDVAAAILGGNPYVVTGTLVLAGGADGLAVGVSGEGVIGGGGK